MQVGDLLLGVELKRRDGNGINETLHRFETVRDAQELFQSPSNTNYDGVILTAWVWRKDKVLTVAVKAKRLFY